MGFSWKSAFLFQARSDFRLLQWLNRSESVELCHRLHYLQMVAEKLAKSFQEVEPPKTSHKAFVTFLRFARNRKDLEAMCGFSGRTNQFKAYLDSMLSVAKAIENLAPSAKVQPPNPEYPWEEQRIDSSGATITIIQAPADHSFDQLGMKLPQMIKIMKFIENCLQLEKR